MRGLVTLLSAGALLYVGFGLLLWLMQERMVFLPNMPGRALTATPEDVGLDYEHIDFEAADGVRLHGWFVPAPDRRGTVLFFHGNAGNISHRLESIAVFRRLGLDTFIIDYRGYGRSEGRPSEAGIYRDADAAWNHLRQERSIAAQEIVIFGRSLGGTAAAWLGAREEPAALIVESSMTSAADMASRSYPIYPTSLILRLEFPVRDAIARATAPVLVVHARQDELIPFAMGEALFAAAPAPKAFLALTGDH
ncbi:MAG: alpha/beta hydrolase, partial [Pseudomonadota bacterium]